jgi:uncharacterized membrane protein
MTARFALLMVAVAGLAACESTKAVDTSPPSQPVAVQAPAPSSSEPRIVRSPIVPDDDVVVADNYVPKKRVKTASVAPVSDPDPADVPDTAAASRPETPAKPDKADTKAEPAPVTTADASSATPPATPADTDGAPTPADTAPDSATPTTDATPAAGDGTTPKSMFSDPSSFMQAQIGGFPVWLVALVGIVLLAALIIGLGGRKKPDEVV